VIVFEGDIVKVGRSNNPDERVVQHVESCSVPIKEGFLFSVVDAVKAERALLNFYYEFRLNGGEWFVIPKDSRIDLETRKKFVVNDCTFWPHCGRKEDCGACLAITSPVELVGLS